MIPLDQTAADRPLPAPAGHGPGAECSVAAGAGAADPTAGHRPAGPAPADTVPQPRPAGGTPDTTADNLRAGLGARLRTAYERGATVAELAAACRRTAAETRDLLLAAGTDLSHRVRLPAPGDPDARPGRVAEQQSEQRPVRQGSAQRPGQPSEQRSDRSGAQPAERDERAPATGRPGRGARSANRWAPAVLSATATPKVEPAPAKRPSPARRLSRLHPRPQGDAATPPAPAERGGPATVRPEPVSETPLGILIGGTPNLPEPENRPQERRYVLAEARMIRPGRGTSLVVLPSWRPAIAVSVPTEQLLAATGLEYGQLPCAVLSVFINPEALHDRELGLHGWRVRPARRGGARNRPA
ncbi:hypothetical protein GCM10010495_27700 [Kitasatospora herbaricolor]|uniref:hypothetical protein n=1 Tax=Kitasatospora herbaricolor TaxID=68217 RepID=UPI00174DCA1D|nr:hypothetical protein [Kitasatospora herbaricolor]MDQ0308440.1 hypothetical protein [Kitasatospora herbaricolor]GGV12596.1 hypothetical protein GCM10010495_27700 [Kitasatospora herbaricolor]